MMPTRRFFYTCLATFILAVLPYPVSTQEVAARPTTTETPTTTTTTTSTTTATTPTTTTSPPTTTTTTPDTTTMPTTTTTTPDTTTTTSTTITTTLPTTTTTTPDTTTTITPTTTTTTPDTTASTSDTTTTTPDTTTTTSDTTTTTPDTTTTTSVTTTTTPDTTTTTSITTTTIPDTTSTPETTTTTPETTTSTSTTTTTPTTTTTTPDTTATISTTTTTTFTTTTPTTTTTIPGTTATTPRTSTTTTRTTTTQKTTTSTTRKTTTTTTTTTRTPTVKTVKPVDCKTATKLKTMMSTCCMQKPNSLFSAATLMACNGRNNGKNEWANNYMINTMQMPAKNKYNANQTIVKLENNVKNTFCTMSVSALCLFNKTGLLSSDGSSVNLDATFAHLISTQNESTWKNALNAMKGNLQTELAAADPAALLITCPPPKKGQPAPNNTLVPLLIAQFVQGLFIETCPSRIFGTKNNKCNDTLIAYNYCSTFVQKSFLKNSLQPRSQQEAEDAVQSNANKLAAVSQLKVPVGQMTKAPLAKATTTASLKLAKVRSALRKSKGRTLG